MEMREKLFITGGSGFIGYHFQQNLSKNRIINYDLQPPFFESNSEYIEGDIRDTQRVKEYLMDCEIILHLAATHFDFQEHYFETNVNGTKSLLKAATEAGVDKIVFYSTVAVYGKVAEPVSEKELPKPNKPYGESKLKAEELIRDWVEEDNNRCAIIIRPTVVYGPYNFGNVFNLIKQIDSGLFMNIGSGDNVKSVVYVKNLVNYTLQLIDNMEPGIKIYNATDEPHYSVEQLTGVIAGKLGKRIPFKIPLSIAKILALPFDLLNVVTGKDWIISSERIEKFCAETHFLSENLKRDGIFQKYTLEKGLEETIEWYQSVDWKKFYEDWFIRVEKYN